MNLLLTLNNQMLAGYLLIVYLSFTVSSNSNFEHTEQNQQEVIKVIGELIKEAIAVVAVANEHACTLWFILLDKNEKVQIKEVTDGYGNKVSPVRSFISGRFLELSVTSETYYVFPEKNNIFLQRKNCFPICLSKTK